MADLSAVSFAVRVYRTVIAITASIVAAVLPLLVLTALGIVSMGCPLCFVIFGGIVGIRLAVYVWPRMYWTRRRSLAHLAASIGFLGTTALIAWGCAQLFQAGTFVTIAVAAIGLFPLYLCETAFDRSLQSPTTST